MCMYVNGGAKIRRSFRKVPCWKVVEWDSERRIWTGPYCAGESYVEGKMLKSDKRVNVCFSHVEHGLHTYVDKSDAYILMKKMSFRYTHSRFRVIECEIPRFSRYIEGLGDDMARCYVSERLKVVKFV